MSKFEYLCIEAPHSRYTEDRIGGERALRVPQVECIMNELGSHGWELVSGGYATTITGKGGPLLFFKRPL